MKKLVLTLAGAMILLTLACSQQPGSTSQAAKSAEPSQPAPSENTPQAFTGEIMDSMCAQAGSHDQMISPKGPKNAKECTLACVKMGAKYVLYDRATKTTYELDDQTKPQTLAGEQVKVTGTYDASSKTIHVENIESAGT